MVASSVLLGGAAVFFFFFPTVSANCNGHARLVRSLSLRHGLFSSSGGGCSQARMRVSSQPTRARGRVGSHALCSSLRRSQRVRRPPPLSAAATRDLEFSQLATESPLVILAACGIGFRCAGDAVLAMARPRIPDPRAFPTAKTLMVLIAVGIVVSIAMAALAAAYAFFAGGLSSAACLCGRGGSRRVRYRCPRHSSVLYAFSPRYKAIWARFSIRSTSLAQRSPSDLATSRRLHL